MKIFLIVNVSYSVFRCLGFLYYRLLFLKRLCSFRGGLLSCFVFQSEFTQYLCFVCLMAVSQWHSSMLQWDLFFLDGGIWGWLFLGTMLILSVAFSPSKKEKKRSGSYFASFFMCSAALSIKMNVLLYAPSLFILMLKVH